ncbi:MAG: DJ-1/PfpI family protein [Opitutaceae bacterium]|nr:DJ-1/PfpI family protein [Opitutaceae bacterium]
MHIGLLLFPKLTLLDLVGPGEVFARVPDAKVHLIWKRRDLVATVSGHEMRPTTTFADCPQSDVLCVPGGPGQVDLMEDEETLAFLRMQAAGVKWVTSVCTGSLILAAAGLLTGYRAGCHWASLDQLELFDVIPVAERVVFDRNRATGGGVTAGIDFALSLVAKMNGEELARAIQLSMEYDPSPPFTGGSPNSAEPALVARLRAQMEPFIAPRRVVSERVAAKLNAAGQ